LARRRQLIDITYSFFIALAISLILIIVVEAVRDKQDISEETANRIGFLMLFPLAVGVFTGMISVVMSLIAWREWRLLVLSLLEILSLVSALTGASSGLVYFVVALYLVACAIFSYEWFGVRRRRRI